MRKIGLVTVARSDYGIYRSLLSNLHADPEVDLNLFVGGMHLSEAHGLSVKAIEDDGYNIAARVKNLVPSDDPTAIAKSIGTGVNLFAEAFTICRPDVLVVLGDRFEMYAAAVAALPLKIPVAHIHGGELTEGVIDDALRHSITKLSHLHFVSNQEYAKRVVQLGEEPWRVTVSGAPALDNLGKVELLTLEHLNYRLNLGLPSKPILVTYHPVTLEYEKTAWQISELLSALEVSGNPIVFTLPNADTSSKIIIEAIKNYVDESDMATLVTNLGLEDYFRLMGISLMMVGNSSSGIIEAPSFALPVINIGTRQSGRLRARNVIDVGYERESITAGINRARSPSFRTQLRGLTNPYSCGNAGEKIANLLKTVTLGQQLISKTFQDLAVHESA